VAGELPIPKPHLTAIIHFPLSDKLNPMQNLSETVRANAIDLVAMR